MKEQTERMHNENSSNLGKSQQQVRDHKTTERSLSGIRLAR
jgi:hypothetical protein